MPNLLNRRVAIAGNLRPHVLLKAFRNEEAFLLSYTACSMYLELRYDCSGAGVYALYL